MRYIFHIHTEYSHDSKVKLQHLYKLLIKNKVEGVAITDHNEVEGAKKFRELFGDKIDVIVGEEIMTSKGEIIGLYLNERIPPLLSPEETIKRIKDQGGIVYLPHPFDKRRNNSCLDYDSIINNINEIDLIEVYNARCISEDFNKDAKELCEKYNKYKIIGADAHTKYELNFNYIDVNSDKKLDRVNFLDQLKEIKHIRIKRQVFIHQITKLVRLNNLIKKGDYVGIYKLFYKRYKRFMSRTS